MMKLATSVVLTVLFAAAPLSAQRPWLTGDARLERDNQVRSGVVVSAEHGRYLGPDFTIALTLAAERLTGNTPAEAALEDQTASAGLRATASLPAARVGLEAEPRLLFGAPAAESGAATLLYAGTARLGLGAGTSLRAHATRDRYTQTLASLDTLVLVRTTEIALDRAGAPGWAGEAVARRASFGDDNPVITVYAWLLAPVSRSQTHSLRAGYAAAWQDAEHSNWVAAGSLTGGPPFQEVEGRYAPYYTPHDVQTHSLLLNTAHALGKAWLLGNAAVGIYATETAPVLVRATGASAVALGFYERRFTPARADLSLIAPAGDQTTITIAGAYNRTAYYRTASLRFRVARSL